MKKLLLFSLLAMAICTLALPRPQAQSDSQGAQVRTKVNPKDGLTDEHRRFTGFRCAGDLGE